MTKLFLSAFMIVLLSGCGGALNILAISRDSGKSHHGFLYDYENGTGDVEITIDKTVFSGSYVSNRPISQTTKDVILNGGVRALLHSDDGQILHCEFQGTEVDNSGICIDDKNKIYDIHLKIHFKS